MHYFKYIIKGFKVNLSRFLAVIAIVALGVGVLVGLLSSPSDLEASMNKYYDEHNLMDLVLKSNIGFSDNCKDIISNEDYVIEALYINEDNMEYNSDKYSARIISRAINNNINTLNLIEGEFPKNEFECVALKSNSNYLDLKIGDEFIFDGNTYRVSGIVSSAEFISIEREYNLNGGNKLDFIFYVDEKYNDFSITDLYIRFNSLSGLNRFSDNYLNKEKTLENDIKKFNDSLINNRLIEIKKSIEDNVTMSVKEELEKTVSPDLIDFYLASDEVKNKIANLTNSLYDEFISKSSPEIYYLNLKSNMSYLSYKENVFKVNKIVVVFPIFFFFIAALVSLDRKSVV